MEFNNDKFIQIPLRTQLIRTIRKSINNRPRIGLQSCKKTNQRFPAGEPTIMKHPSYAWWYAKYVIKDRWPEAEPTILKNLYYAYMYALRIMNSRWSEAEPVMMKDPSLACLYAINIIKGRWREAEPYIMKHPGYWKQYKSQFGIQ